MLRTMTVIGVAFVALQPTACADYLRERRVQSTLSVCSAQGEGWMYAERPAHADALMAAGQVWALEAREVDSWFEHADGRWMLCRVFSPESQCSVRWVFKQDARGWIELRNEGMVSTC